VKVILEVKGFEREQDRQRKRQRSAGCARLTIMGN
jgi:hypothetical protein